MDMTALVHALNAFSDRAADIAVAAVWQGTFLAATLTLCLRLAPRVSAAYRFTLWATAFVVLACLSIFAFLPQFSAGATTSVQAAGEVGRPWLSLDARWSFVVAALWLAASLFRGVDLAIHSLRLRRLWTEAKPVELDKRVMALLAATLTDCGRGQVEVCTSATLQRPSVIGFFKPRILIPHWLFGRLTQGELEQIVLHEAEHLRRRDDWTNLAQKLCLVVFPLNPALVWIERRLCREREMACDDGVIRVTRAPRAYAACLASLAERGLERRVEALSLGAWQHRPELVHRVHSILRSKGGLSPMGARLLLGTLGCGLIVGSVELARSPQLVVFVPERSTVAVDEIKTPDIPKSARVRSVQVAAFEREKSRSHSIHAVSSAASAHGVSNIEPPLATKVTLREPTSSQSAALPVMTKAKHRNDGNANPQNQQWIVLTEWQQIETPSNEAGIRRDYETGASAEQNSDAADSQQGSRIAVTQLIFRIMPASAGLPATAGSPAKEGMPANSGSKSGATPAASSSTSQPGIAAFRDGWLVLQL